MPSGSRNASGKKKVNNNQAEPVDRGSGNVFADVGLPNPDLARAKAELVQRIRDAISQRALSQEMAAALLGLDQPRLSALVRGRIDAYTLDSLFQFLNMLGQHVQITVHPKQSVIN